MAEEPMYNLLQSIDPSKIKVPISERFSKLTLSSNKKQRKRDEEEQRDANGNVPLPEKRESASRNLLQQLSQQQQDVQCSPAYSPGKSKNPLLRSESSRDVSSDERDKSHYGEYYETMDPLNVTDDDEDDTASGSELQQLDVDALSQKVSALSVVCRRPISVSSGSTDPMNEVTQLVSMESQRSSRGELQKCLNIEEIPVKIHRREVAIIPTPYEITDDEDEVEVEKTGEFIKGTQEDEKIPDEDGQDEYDDDDEDEVITISDSSISSIAYDPAAMGVSTLRTYSETQRAVEQLLKEELKIQKDLPVVVLSPAKMERVAAFLRDVSMDQRMRQENGYVEAEDSICNRNLRPEELEFLKKRQHIAAADTEPMTTEDATTEPWTTEEDVTSKSAITKEKDKEIEQQQKNYQALGTDKPNSVVNNEDSKTCDLEKTPQNRPRRLVSADTEVNTTESEMAVSTSKVNKSTPQSRHKRLVSADTVANTTESEREDAGAFVTAKVTPQNRNRRIESADTEPNSTESDKTASKYNILKETAQDRIRKLMNDDIETPKNVAQNRHRRLMSADTEVNTMESDEDFNAPLAPNDTPQNRHRRLQSADTEINTIESDEEADTSWGLKVTPTPRKYEDTEENNLMTQMSSLNLQSPRATKTPQAAAKSIANADTEPNTELSSVTTKAPKTPQSSKRTQYDVRRLASAETEQNTIMTEISFELKGNLRTPQSCKKIREVTQSDIVSSDSEEYCTQIRPNKTPQSKKRPDANAKRLARIETQDNTLMSELQTGSSRPYNSRCEDKKRCLALNDTKANTNLNYSLTPEKTQPSAAHDNEVNSSIIVSSPEMKTPPHKALHESYRSNNSIVSCSSAEQNDITAPEHSITILETDDEESVDNKDASKSPQSNDNNKLSNSFQNESRDDDDDDDDDSLPSMKQIQMSMASINISAKINIKIHIPDSTETSEDDERRSSQSGGRRTNSLPDKSDESEISTNNTDQCKQISAAKGNGHHLAIRGTTRDGEKELFVAEQEETVSDSDKSQVEDDNFVDTAAKLLNQLYGNAWQTPDVMRTLRKTNGSDEKKKSLTSTKKKRNDTETCKTMTTKMVEESILGDFSMFRRNIVQTKSLDSTRLYTPNAKSAKVATKPKECFTEPRNIRKPSKRDENKSDIDKPQRPDEQNTGRTKARPQMAKVSAQNEKWRQLVDEDSNSEGNNASDDDDADWSGDQSLLDSDSDFDIPRVKTNSKKAPTTTRNRKRNTSKNVNTSKDDIVYLDLSKEEVEIQNEVPASPPANHDVTFASKLDDILKTCRRQDKPKLPSSAQSTKSKRKLFTPMFGDDMEADLSAAEVEKKENKEVVNDENDDGILLDDGSCPFDARGKPKKLGLLNKPLEAVKAGKPIFQLTPSPKKPTTPSRGALSDNASNTPISKAKGETKNKTPATARKGDPKTVDDICKTPQYKYSFLKSLDVTVGNAFCHPDARIYRDNFRGKKEDLSRILYELYNEKLFKNKLDVPITWNKKLLNTAGRCLNKKKLGVRSSVIELSEKVLTSADRLRCTLIHELCHAATWIFNGEGGHGKTWKEWAYRANATFPEIPKIGVCHQYEIEYKYTYKCTLCAAKSHAHSKSKKVENIRCSYCHGAIEIFLNKKDKDGNILPTPVREPTGFAKFVKDNYKKYKREDRKHADVMKVLSNEFAAMKLTKVGQ